MQILKRFVAAYMMNYVTDNERQLRQVVKVDSVILTGDIISYIIIKHINNSNNNNKTAFTLFDSKLKQLCTLAQNYMTKSKG